MNKRLSFGVMVSHLNMSNSCYSMVKSDYYLHQCIRPNHFVSAGDSQLWATEQR